MTVGSSSIVKEGTPNKKIPDHARCVFKGEIFEIFQWEQTLFDGSVATFEMARRPSTALVIPLVDGEVCYAQQEQPHKGAFLSLLGGRAEKGEDLLEAAKRELREEAGLASERWVLLRDYHAIGKIEWRIAVFVAHDCRKVCDPVLDAGEKIDVMRASVDEFIDRVMMRPDFLEAELTAEIFSAFDPAKAEKLKAEIRGKK